jgi:4-aminobutyrate aminotransferase / (S)-3-amino-2-methylpropionate transaminase / 5-aminovalerate transaminase
MQPTDTSAAERILADRARYVAPGMSTPRLVVAHAEGARVTDPDGRSFIDFAGGIGCQNTGHRHAAIVEAIKEQADRYLHQCFMIGVYEPYVEVCRRLAELSPCSGGEQRSILVNSGAEAVENAVKIARWATGRPAVVAFDNAFHGRTLLAMSMTSKVKPYKAGFGPFAPEVYRAPSPYPYHGISSDDSITALEHLFKADVDPATVACLVLEPVQGEGGFLAMPPDYPAKLQELCRRYGILWVNDEVQSGVGRTGTMWAIEQYAGAEPDRRRSPARGRDRGRRGDGRRSARRTGRHVRRQSALVRCGAGRPRRRDGGGVPCGRSRAGRHAARPARGRRLAPS